jgi:glucose-6-phosphate 1-dehydrogenase
VPSSRMCCSTQVRVRYKQKPHNKLITVMSGRQLHANELVMRIQPNESLYMTTMSKVRASAPCLSLLLRLAMLEPHVPHQ